MAPTNLSKRAAETAEEAHLSANNARDTDKRMAKAAEKISDKMIGSILRSWKHS